MITEHFETLSRDTAGARILLVEDDVMLREALVDTLQHFGYLVYDAGSGAEALAAARRISTANIDLVISDLVMPGMNALELYEALQVAAYRGKMLVITGYPMPYAGESLVERPDVQWVSKPIGGDELAQLIRRMLRGTLHAG